MPGAKNKNSMKQAFPEERLQSDEEPDYEVKYRAQVVEMRSQTKG